jgi:large subunit ribosomal protein L22
MAITAKLQGLKISARKVRMVADLVRYKTSGDAEAILRFTPKKASLPILKLLQSAMATVKNTYKLDPKDFFVAKLMVNDGQMSERVFPRSRGRADKLQKRTSHITMILEETKTMKPRFKRAAAKKAIARKALAKPASAQGSGKAKPAAKATVAKTK